MEERRLGPVVGLGTRRTFGGDELMKKAYEEAVREEYRFYSYGDAMLIL